MPTRRPEICPQEMAATYLDIKNRVGNPLEPLIKNYEVWLNWHAHQLDSLHWWGELVAIPDVEDPRRLAWKIHASFLIPVVRCGVLLNEDYTMSFAPKCLISSRFLPDDPTSQDVQWQPLLLTLVCARALQYWAEKVNLPTLNTYHPLVMSVVELKWQMEGCITFSKQDVFCSLGDAVPEARSQDTEAHQKALLPHPTLPILELWNPSLQQPMGELIPS